MLKILGTLMKNVWIKDLQLHQDGKTKVRGSNLLIELYIGQENIWLILDTALISVYYNNLTALN